MAVSRDPVGKRGFKIGKKSRNALLQLAAGDRVQPAAEDAQQKQPLPERVGAIGDQRQRNLADGPKPGQQRGQTTPRGGSAGA